MKNTPTLLISQTNVQLLDQLVEAGLPRSELEKLADTCDFMGELFTGGYRETGRPFYNHLIGTASILARETRDADLIAAEILHSAYTFARFPTWLLPPGLNKKREVVRNRIGEKAEQHIYHYLKADWRKLLNPDYLQDLSNDEKSLLLMKLADMLEDFIEDKGPIESGKIPLWPLNELANPVERLIRLSEGIGADWIADAFRSLADQPAPKIISREASIAFFHAPLRSVLPYNIKSALRHLKRR